MKLEKLKIVDSVNHKTVHVMVTPELAKRCRTDSSFVMNLLNNVKTGSYIPGTTPVKSENLPQGSSDLTPEVKCSWSNFETLKLIELYTKYKQQFQVLPRRTVWSTVAGELTKFNINKTPEKCDEKWRNLIRTFKAVKNSDRKNHGKFAFYNEVKSALSSHGDAFIQSKIDTNKSSEFTNVWSYNETKALIEIYEENEDEINVKNKEWPKFWAMVSQKLSERGLDKSAKQCEQKWKKMEEKYTKHKKGDSVEKFEFSDEFDRIFGDNIPDEMDSISLNDEGDENEDDSMMVNSTTNNELLDVLDKYVLSKDNAVRNSTNTKNADSTTALKVEQKFDEDGGFMDELLNDMEGGEGQDGKIFWSRDETEKLIKAYRNHKEDFKTCTRKRDVWQMISDELANENVMKSSDKCETKWKNLLRTYKRLNKSCLFENKGTRFLFYQEIDEAITQDVLSSKGDKSSPMVIKQEKMELSESITPWTHVETQALLEVYEKHRNGNNFTFSNQFWRAISDELEEEKGIIRDPKSCEQKMKNLKMQYKSNLSASGSHSKIPYFDELKRIFQNSSKQEQLFSSPVVTNSDEEPKAKKLCTCANERELAKQKRHEEIVSLMQKKIDIEERKLECFERYLELLQRKETGDFSD